LITPKDAMNRLHRPSLTLALLGVSWLPTACWSTDGLGLGPYSRCGEPTDCSERDLSACLYKRLDDPDEPPEPLFCSQECPPEGSEGCPLADVDWELKPICLAPVDRDQTYCALTTLSSACPTGMSVIEIDDERVCVFDE
jgi:hypothetical protein